jgi:acetyl-CoA carboxylase biotin carboxyl carrier protein
VARKATGWLQTVQVVIGELRSSDVTEFELAQREFRLRVRRQPKLGQPGQGPDRAALRPRGIPVTAPLTGIFYRASTPTAPPFVNEGEWVDAGATIGLIETMKIFNEVTVEQGGLVERFLAQNGQLVHAGDPVLTMMPAERPGPGATGEIETP